MSNLAEEDKRDGFLLVEFSPQQFEEMNSEIPIIVADLGSQLGGYLCAASLQSSAKIPLLAHMMSLFREVSFNSYALNRYRSFLYGPICIEKSFRGRGVMEGLFNHLLHNLEEKFDVGVLFVSQNNPRSLHAHLSRLKMEKVCEFEFNDQEFNLLAFEVPTLRGTNGGEQIGKL
ncbi:hypothetical protein ACFL9T_16450 [Thermodesulfobacteriota bacterium]